MKPCKTNWIGKNEKVINLNRYIEIQRYQNTGMINSITTNWIGKNDKVINLNPYIKIQKHENTWMINSINTKLATW